MRLSRLVCIAAVGLATGCIAHTQEPTSTGTRTTGAEVSGVHAVRRIAEARCDRAQACNDIGSGHAYADRGACIRDMSRDTRKTLDDEACETRAIDERRLNECIKDIRNEGCNDPFESIERAASCRRGELCD